MLNLAVHKQPLNVFTRVSGGIIILECGNIKSEGVVCTLGAILSVCKMMLHHHAEQPSDKNVEAVGSVLLNSLMLFQLRARF